MHNSSIRFILLPRRVATFKIRSGGAKMKFNKSIKKVGDVGILPGETFNFQVFSEHKGSLHAKGETSDPER